MSLQIRILASSDLELYRQLRFEALANSPSSFFTLLEEEEKKGPENYTDYFNDPAHTAGQYMFGLFDGDMLVGLTGLSREPRIKRNHIAWVGSVYVTPKYRGRQFGKMLVQHAVNHARTLEGVELVQLSVESSNTPAINAYLSVGFTPWGVETPAAIHNGVEYSETYMSLRIKNSNSVKFTR